MAAETTVARENGVQPINALGGQNRGRSMKTSYGLEFRLQDKGYLDSLDGYDKVVASTHLANSGKIITYPSGEPIDNEYDLEEIYGMIRKQKK